MWRAGTDESGRRAAALLLVTLLVSVLSAFSLAAVSYLLSRLDADSYTIADARAFYVAEVGVADARAYVAAHAPGPWPHIRALTTVCDDRGAAAGQYSYTITDLTLPEQNERRRVEVHGYWPAQENTKAECQVQVWLEKRDDAWCALTWATGACAVGG